MQVGAFFSIPFDSVKTQLQRMQANEAGVLPYTGPLDCTSKLVRAEGIRRLWVGGMPWALRVGPILTIQWLVIEQLLRVETRVGL